MNISSKIYPYLLLILSLLLFRFSFVAFPVKLFEILPLRSHYHRPQQPSLDTFRSIKIFVEYTPDSDGNQTKPKNRTALQVHKQ